MDDFAEIVPGDHVEGALHEVGVSGKGEPLQGDEAVIIAGDGGRLP